MTPADKARAVLADPILLGAALGYKDFKYGLHDEWIRDMILGTEDMTLQAHRGSYKTTCLAVAIACMMIYYRGRNIIFLRKTDADVVEVIKNVRRILGTDVFRQIFLALTGEELFVVKETSTEITTSAYCAPRGASQLLGIGIGGSFITPRDNWQLAIADLRRSAGISVGVIDRIDQLAQSTVLVTVFRAALNISGVIIHPEMRVLLRFIIFLYQLVGGIVHITGGMCAVGNA